MIAISNRMGVGSAFALAPWAGSHFYDAGDITVSELVIVMFASMIASVSFGLIAPQQRPVQTVRP